MVAFLKFMAVAALALFAALPLAAEAAGPGAETIVDAMNTIFGKHPHVRANHAKGRCVKGVFAPAPEAASLTKSPNFAKPVPMLGRFSMGGGNPAIPDATKSVIRGFAFRLDFGGTSSSDFAFISAPVQFAKDPAQFLGFLEARFPGPDGKPDPAKIKAFGDANPETKRQGEWLASRPVPASYASVNYWGIHVFTLEDGRGGKTAVKFKLAPAGGEAGLTDGEAKAKPADFLAAELGERLAKGPAGFDFLAIIGEAGDPKNDPTAFWPEEKRKTVKLGVLTVEALEDNATCDAGIFDPARLADGIAGPEDDPLFEIRSSAYAVSLSRRVD